MTISSPTFTRLQDGIKSVDDLRVRGPINAALGWLSGDLVDQLNTHFDAISQSTSVQIQAAIVAFSNSNSEQIASAISTYASTRPTFMATNGSIAQPSISGTAVQVLFGSETWDVGSYFASNAWTPPNGRYRVSASVVLDGTAAVDAEQATTSIYVGGALFRSAVNHRSGTSGLGTLISVDVSVSGTAAIEVRIAKSGAGTGQVAASGSQVWFCGEAIS